MINNNFKRIIKKQKWYLVSRLPVVLKDERVVGVELAEGALHVVVDRLEVRLEYLGVLAHEIAQLALVHVRALHVLREALLVPRVVAAFLAPVWRWSVNFGSYFAQFRDIQGVPSACRQCWIDLNFEISTAIPILKS